MLFSLPQTSDTFTLPQVSHVLAALQAGNRGTQACITAASAVSGIIADLDTTIMFATAGSLNRENAETFADHRYSTACVLLVAHKCPVHIQLTISLEKVMKYHRAFTSQI